MKELKHLAQGSKHPPVQKGQVRIYNMRFCPYAQRSLLVAAAKGIAIDVVNVNLVDKPDWFLALNPKGMVPTLELDDGRALAESILVSDYLDETGDESRMLYPKDPFQKAKERLLIERFNDVINPFFKVLLHMDKPVDMAAFEETLKNLDAFERELKGRGKLFFGGDQPMMADYMLWPWFERLELITHLSGGKLKFSRERFSRLFEWMEDMKEDEAVKKWFLSVEDHAVYIKSRLAGAIDYDFLVRQ